VKLRIELTDGSEEDEVVIRCGRMDDTIQKLQEYILTLAAPKLVFYKDSQEYYLSLDDILFFETNGEQVFAHTQNDAFKVKYKLYELEDMLPGNFVRAAKGTIVNTQRIYAINRNLTASSQISFSETHKQIYASRHYYSSLKMKMKERSV